MGAGDGAEGLSWDRGRGGGKVEDEEEEEEERRLEVGLSITPTSEYTRPIVPDQTKHHSAGRC